jgi:hypothetical protein
MIILFVNVIYDTEMVAEGNSGSRETAMRSLRCHGMLVGVRMDKLNG